MYIPNAGPAPLKSFGYQADLENMYGNGYFSEQIQPICCKYLHIYSKINEVHSSKMNISLTECLFAG